MGNDITVKKNGITYHYSEKVLPESQKNIDKTISSIFDKSWKDPSFFDGLYIDAYGTHRESKEFRDNNWQNGAFTYYPVDKKWKTICIKTNKVPGRDFGALFNKKLDDKIVADYLAHELGHIFDYNYANPDETTKKRLTEILAASETATEEEYKILEKEYEQLWDIYSKQNGLSDSEEFREAWRKDVDNTFKGKSWWKNSITENKLGYFSPRFDFSISNKNEKDYSSEITLNDGIDDDELDMADNARSEIFAQLFSYAMGFEANEEQKILLLDVYKNTYKVVVSYINKYLGTFEPKPVTCNKHSRLSCER